MKLDKKTATIVLVSTAIGFVGDVLTYSLGESKGKKFKIAIPRGAELYKLLALGVVSGFAIDYAVKTIESSLQNVQEKKLAEIYNTEKQLISEGKREKQLPKEVIYTPLAGFSSRLGN